MLLYWPLDLCAPPHAALLYGWRAGECIFVAGVVSDEQAVRLGVLLLTAQFRALDDQFRALVSLRDFGPRLRILAHVPPAGPSHAPASSDALLCCEAVNGRVRFQYATSEPGATL